MRFVCREIVTNLFFASRDIIHFFWSAVNGRHSYGFDSWGNSGKIVRSYKITRERVVTYRSTHTLNAGTE